MTQKSTVSLKGPAIALGLIVLGAIVAEYMLIPTPEPAEGPATAQVVKQEPTPEPSAPPVSQDVPAAETWSTYHGGPDLCGFTDVRLPDKPALLWQYIAEGAIRQPLVGDNLGVYLATSKGAVVALDFQGKLRWSTALTKPAKDSGTPVHERLEAPISCFRSVVFVGSISGLVHALDATSGVERWTYDVGGEILGAVNFDASEDGEQPARLFVIERSEGALHCIDFETGKQLWRTDAISRCDGSVSVANGKAVYGSCACAFHAYTVDGRIVRNIELCADCQIANGPALVGNDIYSGSRSGHFFRADVSTGRIIWTNQDSTKELFTTPAVGPDLVVFGSEDGNVYALDRESGKVKWRFKSQGVPTSPVIAKDTVIVGSNGVLRFLRLDTGEETWNYEVSDGIASPSIINGMVIVGSEDGTVAAFGTKQNGQVAS